MQPLHGVGGVLRDDLPGRRVAGQGDEPDVGVADERVAGRDAVSGHDLEDARWNHVLRELHEAEQRQRCLLGGLDDLHVPGGERRADLPDGHVQRVVPGADSRDDPERLAPDHRCVALDVLPGRLALEVPRGTGEEAQAVGHRRWLVLRDPPRLADVRGLEPGELLCVLVDDVRERQQELHPVLRRLQLPGGPCVLRGIDRARDVVCACTRHLGDHLTGRRIQDLHGLATRGLDPLTADELLVLGYRNAHSRPPFGEIGGERNSLQERGQLQAAQGRRRP